MRVQDKEATGRVSISQLKGSPSTYLALVKGGQSLVITDRGIGVAVLSPVAWDAEDDPMRDLVLSGQVSPPSERLGDDFFRGPNFEDPGCCLRRYLRGGRDEL